MEMISQGVATFLVNALWQIPLLAAAAALAARLMRSSPPRHQHWLWLVTLGLGLTLPLASFRAAAGAARVLEPQVVQSWVGGATPVLLARKSQEGLSAPSASATGRSPIDPEGSNRAAGAPRSPYGLPALPISPSAARILSFGFLLFLLFRAVSLSQAWRRTLNLRKRACSKPLPGGFEEFMERSRRAFGTGPVAVFSSLEVEAPVTLGVSKPAILLPEGFVDRSSPDELASVLAHEMSHIARHDYLINFISELVSLPVSFHPAAGLILRRIRESREIACDELAVTRVVASSTYARSLVAIAERLVATAPGTVPGYSLGIFDANNLEDRVMKLLDKRPRASAGVVRASLLATLVLFGATCFSAYVFSFTVRAAPEGGFAHDSDTAEHPDFSGRWNLDKSRSNLPSPSPEDLVETIDHRDPQLKIVTTSRDWSAREPIAQTLFTVMIPEISTTTDNRENTAQFGPGELKSKTRWDAKNLVTEWGLERDGQREMEGTWTRSLSADGKTMTLQVVAGEPESGVQGTTKLVFVKGVTSGTSLGSFVGTWQAKFEGQTYIVVNLRQEGEALGGSVSLGNFGVDADGQVNHVQDEPSPDHANSISSAQLEGDTLNLVAGAHRFQMKVVGEDQAKIKWTPPNYNPSAPEPGWWTIARVLANAENEVIPGGPSGGVVGGVPGGVGGGVPGRTRTVEGEAAPAKKFAPGDAVNVVRLINTAEADYKSKAGKYANWRELLNSPTFNETLNRTEDVYHLGKKAVNAGPEVIPGYQLKLVVSSDGDHYILSLEEAPVKDCAIFFYSDERGLIQEGKNIGCSSSRQ
jgi:bla regulator protein blaR1